MNGSNSYPKVLTDETIRENTSHGTEKYPFEFYLEDIWEFDFHCIDWHWHPELEFVYLETGSATVWAGNNRYHLTAGTAFFVNTQIIHRYESTEPAITPNIVFSPLLLAPKENLIYQKFIQPILSSGIDCVIFSQDVAWQKKIINILNLIFSLQNSSNSCELQTVQLLLKLWQIMYENMGTSLETQSNKTDIQEQARLQIMLHYIHENYQQNITLEELAQVIALSKSSILNLFNAYVHMSPIDYVIHYKLKQAAQLLDTTENTISSIAQSTGFHNVGYFCRKFKDVFKVTPGQYRKLKQ